MKKRIQNETIIAALIAEGSIKAAAVSIGCAPRTVYNRMRKPDFKILYSQAKAELVKNVTAKLQGQMCNAIDTLVEIMNDTDAAKQTRANCAVSILQYGARFTETADILERLEEIERIQAINDVI